MRYVAILGPPATGKSTLARALTSLLQCHYFRLRRWAPMASLINPKTGEPRDWLEERAVRLAITSFLRSVADQGQTEPASGFVADNFPGTKSQVYLFHELTTAHFGPSQGTYLLLEADAVVLGQRANERRVCQSCEADPLADAHLPAESSPLHPERCRDCGAGLMRRRNDAPAPFALRLKRYRAYERGLRTAVGAVGANLLELDASLPVAELVGIFQTRLGGG